MSGFDQTLCQNNHNLISGSINILKQYAYSKVPHCPSICISLYLNNNHGHKQTAITLKHTFYGYTTCAIPFLCSKDYNDTKGFTLELKPKAKTCHIYTF